LNKDKSVGVFPFSYGIHVMEGGNDRKIGKLGDDSTGSKRSRIFEREVI